MRRLKIGWNEEALQFIIKQTQQIFLVCLSRRFRYTKNNEYLNNEQDGLRMKTKIKVNNHVRISSLNQVPCDQSGENSSNGPKLESSLELVPAIYNTIWEKTCLNVCFSQWDWITKRVIAGRWIMGECEKIWKCERRMTVYDLVVWDRGQWTVVAVPKIEVQAA